MSNSNPLLRASWSALALTVGAKGDARKAFEDLVAAYSEPERAYHNLTHISDCLAELQGAKRLPEHPNEVEMALWMHDAKYDPKRDNNEERSAEFALQMCKQLVLPDQFTKRTYDLILATRHSQGPASIDEQVVVDIDLSILGKPAPIFDNYDAAIRQEFSWVTPQTDFMAKRAQILQSILGRKQIYSTQYFRDRYEKAARANLQRAITELGAKLR